MRSIFIKKENVKGDSILIRGEQFHYLKRVLRFKGGEEIELKTENEVYLSKLYYSTEDTLQFKVVNKREVRKVAFNIIICLSLIKEKAFIFALQKLTELCVSTIIPYSAMYSTVRIKDERQKNKRWNTICKEASEQSGNDSYPRVMPIFNSIRKVSEYSNTSNKIILNEKEQSTGLKQAFNKIKPNSPILIMIGPEGGFTEEEIDKAKSLDFISSSLGSSTLRSETACITAVSNILFYLS